MGTIDQDSNHPMNTLKPQPGQSNSYNPKFHPLPGPYAQSQLSRTTYGSQSSTGPNRPTHQTELTKALASEREQHEYWEKWQGVTPGRAVYENPRELQNTLLPSAKYGVEGRGYG